MAALRPLRVWMVSRQVSSDTAYGQGRKILITCVHSLVLQVRSERHATLETVI